MRLEFVYTAIESSSSLQFLRGKCWNISKSKVAFATCPIHTNHAESHVSAADDSSRVGHAERETRRNTWPAKRLVAGHTSNKKRERLAAERVSSTREQPSRHTHTCWACYCWISRGRKRATPTCITRAPLTFQPGRAHLFGRSLLPARSRGKKQRDTK